MVEDIGNGARTRYCHNKNCESFNKAQGDWGIEDNVRGWECISCFRKLTKKNNKELIL